MAEERAQDILGNNRRVKAADTMPCMYAYDYMRCSSSSLLYLQEKIGNTTFNIIIKKLISI